LVHLQAGLLLLLHLGLVQVLAPGLALRAAPWEDGAAHAALLAARVTVAVCMQQQTSNSISSCEVRRIHNYPG
jgi:hypothetical protein